MIAFLFALLFWGLLAILAVAVLALVTPLLIGVHLTTRPHICYRVEVRALAGLAPRLTVIEGPRDKAVDADRRKKSVIAPRALPNIKRGQGHFARALPFLVRDILRRLHLAELHIDADYGLGDPADTGQLCGLLLPLQHAAPLPAAVSLDLRPDFTGACLSGSLTAGVRVTMATLLFPLLRFGWRVYGPQR
jgi:hypothetical protein